MKRAIIYLLLGVFVPVCQAADYYWVGGSGNWSDITNWRTTSGGTVQHSVVPSSDDDVFFDANSFSGPNQRVTISNQNVFCRSMDWTGASGMPVLEGAADQALNAAGSFILIADMRFEFEGEVRLDGDGGGSIAMAGHNLRGPLVMRGGAASQWQLEAPLVSDGTVSIYGGGLITNDHDIACQKLLLYATSATSIVLGSSTVTLQALVPIMEINNREHLPLFGAHTDQLSFDAGSSVFILQRPRGDLRVSGQREIAFNEVRFAAPRGTSRINYTRWWHNDFYDWNSPTVSFRRLVCRSNVIFHGNHRFGQLQLAPGSSYKYRGNTLIEIDDLMASGSCASPITLSTIETDQLCDFRFSRDQMLAYTSIRNIQAVGGGSYSVTDGADLGNAVGWSIIEKSGQDLYWVGGEGNWDDPMHWAMSSGGAGGACVPFPSDNVIFDENSFSGNDTVRVNVEDALCHSMTWRDLTSSPIFRGMAHQSLNIYGSLEFSPSMEMQFEGDVNFLTSEPSQTIDMGGHSFFHDVFFLGSGGWLFTSAFETKEYVFLENGTLNTNSQQVTMESLESLVFNPRTLILGSSQLDFRTERYYGLYVQLRGEGMTLDAGTSTLNFYGSGYLQVWGNIDATLRWHHVNFFGFGNIDGYRVINSAAQVTAFMNGHYDGALNLDRLILTPGFSYEFSNSNDFELYIDQLDANGTCAGTIRLSSLFPDVSATISTSSDQQFSNLSIRDVHVDGGTFTATQSKDDGNTVGWVIDDAVVGRDLYWVGGTGVWEDPAHWSLSSGGPGGECVPNILDNVFFDANSLAPDEYVDTRNYSTAVCHNFTWDGPPASAQFWRWENGGDCCADFHIYGSLDIQTPFILNMSGLEFRGSGDQDYIINTAGVFMNFVQFVNSTQRRLTDDFHGREIRMNAGGLKTSSHSMELQRLEIDSRGAGVQMDLDSSHILLTYPWSRSNYASLHLGSDENLIFDPDHSLIELNNDAVSHIHWHSEYAFHNVLFSSQVGSAELFRGGRDEQLLGTVPMNKLEFRGDGVVYGEHRIDSLLFANGRSYTLESEKIQTVVDHLQIRGNNCIQLGLRSTQAGNPSIIEMAQGEVDGDFIQMQDQIARGGAQFFAGANSADVSNNEGWIFETVQEYVEFGVLGNDRIFCVGQVSLTLNEDDQIGAQGYVWSDGSTGAELDVSSPGKYWVDATYVQGCVLPDTILVLEADDFNVDLGTDQLLCSGVALTLNADLSLVGARYTWGDGISGAERVLDQAGIYDVTVELDGCTDSDTLRLDYVQVPDLALAGSGACLGDTLDLSIDIPNVSVLWSTGATSPGIRVYAPGEYWAQISTNGCSDADTLEIAFEDPIVFDLGPDTLLCEGDELIISGLPDQSNVQYLWEDGVAVADRSISTAGSYRLSAARGLCAFTDSISVTTLDLTLPDLAPTAQYCAGEMANFAVPVDSDQRILWSTGSMIESISLDETGTYWVRVEEAHCAVSDTFDVAFTVPPALSLDEEMAICQGDRVKLGEDIQGATYMWSTGKVTAEVEESPSDNTLYTVEARFGRCASVDSILLIVRPRPMVLIDAPAEVCPSTDYSIAIISDGDALSWMDGDTSAIREFSLPGDFQVTAQLDGCFRDTSFIVEAFPTQFRSLGPDTLICDDTEIQIDLTVPQGISYDWNDGYTESVRTLQMAGSYAVEVDDGNCVFQDTMELTTRSCVYFNAYAPNAFSPNGDGINDEFAIVFDPRIPISNFQLEIFDRWGNQVYAATDPSRWWNGMIKGEVLQGDVYLYHVSFDYIDDNGPGSYEHAADVLLVR